MEGPSVPGSLLDFRLTGSDRERCGEQAANSFPRSATIRAHPPAIESPTMGGFFIDDVIRTIARNVR